MKIIIKTAHTILMLFFMSLGGLTTSIVLGVLGYKIPSFICVILFIVLLVIAAYLCEKHENGKEVLFSWKGKEKTNWKEILGGGKND